MAWRRGEVPRKTGSRDGSLIRPSTARSVLMAMDHADNCLPHEAEEVEEGLQFECYFFSFVKACLSQGFCAISLDNGPTGARDGP